MEVSLGQVYAFGSFHLDPARRLLSTEGRPVRLTAKVFDLLLLLVRNQERVLSRTELLDALWPDTVVEEGNLSVNMSLLRKALADTGSEQRYIETLPRLGYRFVGDAREERVKDLARRAEGKLGDVSGGRPAAARPAPFVGRASELARLHELFDRAWGGRGASTVFVHAEPGMGKTTLAQRFMAELAQRSEPLVLATGRCLQQHGAGEAYLPFLDGLSGMLSGPHATVVRRVMREQAPSWCRYFPAVFAAMGEGDAVGVAAGGFDRLLREARAGLGTLSREIPLLLLLEDLHWADPSSIDLLRGLIAGAGTERQLVIATFRPAEVEAGKHSLGGLLRELRMHECCEELALQPLSDTAIGQYLAERFDHGQLPMELSQLLESKTEGHPLLLTRVVQWLVDRGDLSEVGDGWGLTCPLATLALEVPQSIESMILGRLELLTSEEQRTLTYASVEGDEFTSTVLAGLLGKDEIELEEQLAGLEQVHRLIERQAEDRWPSRATVTRYRFGHTLYRDFLYQRIVPRRRRQLHGQVASTLVEHFGAEARELGARLAVHFEQAGQVTRAIEYLCHAGQNAKAIYAYREAEAHYCRALELAAEHLSPTEQPRCRLDIHRERGWIRWHVGQYAAATQDFDQMLVHARSLGDLAAQSDASHGHWCVATFSGSSERCLSEAQNMLRLAEEMGDDLRKARALGILGAREFSSLGDLDLAGRHLDDAIALTRSVERTPNGSSALRTRGGVLHTRACLRELQSDYAGAVSDNLESLGDRASGPSLQLSNLFDRGRARANLGQIELSLDDFSAASELARRSHQQHFLGRISNSLAWIHRELEDLDEARRQDEAALELGVEHRDAFSRLYALLHLAEDHARGASRGSAHAQALLAEAERLSLTQEFGCNRHKLHLRILMVRSQVLQGQAEPRAEAVARTALELATSKGARKYIALAHWKLAQAQVGRGAASEAKSSLLAALSALRGRPCPLLEWRLHAALGEVNLGLADAGAQGDFGRAREIIESIASNLKAGSLKDAFLNSVPVERIRSLAP